MNGNVGTYFIHLQFGTCKTEINPNVQGTNEVLEWIRSF